MSRRLTHYVIKGIENGVRGRAFTSTISQTGVTGVGDATHAHAPLECREQHKTSFWSIKVEIAIERH